MSDLNALFSPRTVAILGASTQPHKQSYRFLESMLDSGFDGEIYPINPRGGEILGRRVYTSIEEVDGPIDVVLNTLAPDKTPEAIVGAAQRGARYAVIFTAGFAEAGEEGRARQEWMVAEARRSGMRIVGPNCMGIFNLNAGMNLTGISGIPSGPIGVISQSGNVGLTLWHQAGLLDTGFSKFIGIGNQADLAAHEFIDFLGSDPQTAVIAMYLEGLKGAVGDKFLEVAMRVSRDKPIVAIKGGRTRNAQRAAESHTAAMTTTANVYSAAFKQAGIIEVQSQDELLPVAEALYRCPPFKGKRAALVGSGGGHSILAVDAVELNGLEVTEFPSELTAKIRERLPAYAPAANPVDMTGAYMGDLSLFSEFTRLALESEHDYGGALNFALYGYWGSAEHRDKSGRSFEDAAPLLGAVQRAVSKPVIFYTPYANRPHPAFTRMREAGTPCYDSLDTAARCLRALAERAKYLEGAHSAERSPRSATARQWGVPEGASSRAPGNLTEPEAIELLHAYDVPVVPSLVAHDPDEAVAHARELGYPVVLKLVSDAVLHKTDVGGVKLDLRSEDEVRRAFQEIASAVTAAHGQAPLAGVIVAPFRSGGVELMVGVARDATFGATILLGAGGIDAETTGDFTLRVMPARKIELSSMIRELRAYPVLLGTRGRPPADLDGLVELLERVQELALANPTLAELDLNPVLVNGSRIEALDARVIVQAPAPTAQHEIVGAG